MTNPNTVDSVPAKAPDDDFLLTRFFNWLGDQFAKMVGGVVHFIPRFFRAIFRWLISEKLRKLIYSIVRFLVWMTIWLVVVFGIYTWMEYEKVWGWIVAAAAYIKENFAWLISLFKANFKQIWTTLALIGSVYGLIHGTVRWWRRKKSARKVMVNSDDAKDEVK